MKKIVAQGVGSTYTWIVEPFHGKHLVCEYHNDVFMCVVDTCNTIQEANERISAEPICELADASSFPSM